MNRLSPPRVLAVAGLCGALASGCAAATSTSCRPGDPTVTCCIKKYPLSPAESCAASSAEILETLMAMEAAFQATRHTEGDDEEADDFANNADLPAWKQRCIKYFVDCRNQRWSGNCYDCIRRCEGQQDWPFGMCAPVKGKQR